MKRPALYGLGAVAAAALAGGLWVYQYFYKMAVCRQRPTIPKPICRAIDRGQQDDIFRPELEKLEKEIEPLPYKEKNLRSKDGLLLKGRLYLPETPKRVILLMHGWRSDWKHDFSVLLKPLLAMGCALLFADERGHGKSEGDYMTYGIRESEDCVLWANMLVKEFPDLPLYLWGMSMGATSVLRASADPSLPENLRGVIADCGFTGAAEEMEHLVKKKLGFGGKIVPVLYRRRIGRRCGFDLFAPTTEEILKNNRLPLLLFHGLADDFVPTEMSRRNFAAAGGKKKLVLVEGAVHCKCFHIAPKRCLAEVKRFFEENDEMKPSR